MNGFATWLADVLTDAGLHVRELDGWRTRGHYDGGFSGLRAVVWHHDASGEGDSPGVPAAMLGNWDVAAAQLWVDRSGVWHVLAAGPAYHAGRVLPGKPDNHTSLGVETDHTTGEDWPEAQLLSLRVGTHAILSHLGTDAAHGLEFHRTVCSPPGRKSDPDGLVLADERRRVDAVAHPVPGLVPPPRPPVDLPLHKGDHGDRVGDVQRALAKAGNPDLQETGSFDGATDLVLRRFQDNRGIDEDGVVGPLTWAALRVVAHA
ncbi:MAG: Peptidoglycan-binding domain 1 protein [Frankiales bacterium]|nr:Peptidoglycan-binding domain 1 protein [Frankiales bacterium]